MQMKFYNDFTNTNKWCLRVLFIPSITLDLSNCKRHCDVEKHADEGVALLSKNENDETELMKGIISLIISLMLLMKKNSDLMVFLPSLFELLMKTK